MTETEDSYVFDVEVPGVAREDIAIEAVRNELTISGEFKEKEKTGRLRSRTRRTGRFEHRSVLPRDVGAEKITAELADGVLTVTVPKAEAAKPAPDRDHLPVTGARPACSGRAVRWRAGRPARHRALRRHAAGAPQRNTGPVGRRIGGRRQCPTT